MTEIYWAAGFDRGNPFPTVDCGSFPQLATDYFKTGSRSFAFSTWTMPSEYCRRLYPSEVSYPVVGCHMHAGDYFLSRPGDSADVYNYGYPYIMITATNATSFRFTYAYEDNTFRLYRGTSNIQTGTVRVLQNNWMHLEAAINYHQHSGFVRFWLDGHLCLDFQGSTQPTATQAYAQYVYWGGGTYSVLGQNTRVFLDNPVIGGYGRLRDIRVEEFAPNRDLSVMFVNNTHAYNYETVDDALPDAGDYNSTQETGHVDVLGFQSFSSITVDGISKRILGVQTWAEARMDVASGDTIYIGIVNQSSVSKTENILFDASYRMYHMAQVNPATNTAWLADDVNESGIWYESNLNL